MDSQRTPWSAEREAKSQQTKLLSKRTAKLLAARNRSERISSALHRLAAWVGSAWLRTEIWIINCRQRCKGEGWAE